MLLILLCMAIGRIVMIRKFVIHEKDAACDITACPVAGNE